MVRGHVKERCSVVSHVRSTTKEDHPRSSVQTQLSTERAPPPSQRCFVNQRPYRISDAGLFVFSFPARRACLDLVVRAAFPPTRPPTGTPRRAISPSESRQEWGRAWPLTCWALKRADAGGVGDAISVDGGKAGGAKGPRESVCEWARWPRGGAL